MKKTSAESAAAKSAGAKNVPAKNASAKSSGRSIPDLAPEYRFDYGKAKPNRFAGKTRAAPVVVALDADVAKVFKTGESVNAMLRSIVKALPPTGTGR